MTREVGTKLLAVSAPGTALAAGLGAFLHVTEPPHPAVPPLAWIMCACYAALAVIGLSTWGLPRLRASKQTVAQTAQADAQAMGGRTADAQADGGEWDKLPVMAVPVGDGDMRRAVVAFARQHGLRPYESDRGFVLADAGGAHYRVTAA